MACNALTPEAWIHVVALDQNGHIIPMTDWMPLFGIDKVMAVLKRKALAANGTGGQNSNVECQKPSPQLYGCEPPSRYSTLQGISRCA